MLFFLAHVPLNLTEESGSLFAIVEQWQILACVFRCDKFLFYFQTWNYFAVSAGSHRAFGPK